VGSTNITQRLVEELKQLRKFEGVSRSTAEKTPIFRALANHERKGYVVILESWIKEFAPNEQAAEALNYAFNMCAGNSGRKLHIRRSLATNKFSMSVEALVRIEDEAIVLMAEGVADKYKEFLANHPECQRPPEPPRFAHVVSIPEALELINEKTIEARGHFNRGLQVLDDVDQLRGRVEQMLGITP
jgi:hypothetical protein